jgi:recombination protein RecT
MTSSVRRNPPTPAASPGTDVEQQQGKGTTMLELAQRGATALLTAIRQEWAAITPAHVDSEAFIALAAAYVRRDQNLTQAMIANPQSLILALRECAVLGHMPVKGMFSLVAFRDRSAFGGWSIVGVEEWRGVVERMYRSGGVVSVHVAIGREHDRVLGFQRGTDVLPRHLYDEFASRDERGPLKAVWAYARLHTGGWSDVAWLNRHDVARHRGMSKTATYVKAGAQEATGGNFWGPSWPDEGPNTEAMWKKTSLHVLEGLVPASAEYRWQVGQSEAAAAANPRQGIPDVPPRGSDWVEAEVVPDGGWPQVAQPGGTS